LARVIIGVFLTEPSRGTVAKSEKRNRIVRPHYTSVHPVIPSSLFSWSAAPLREWPCSRRDSLEITRALLAQPFFSTSAFTLRIGVQTQSPLDAGFSMLFLIQQLEVSPIDLVKADIEGAKVDVLAGVRKVLKVGCTILTSLAHACEASA